MKLGAYYRRFYFQFFYKRLLKLNYIYKGNMLCLYHNESKNMNPNHVENHNRIDIPIKYLYNKSRK